MKQRVGSVRSVLIGAYRFSVIVKTLFCTRLKGPAEVYASAVLTQ